MQVLAGDARRMIGSTDGVGRKLPPAPQGAVSCLACRTICRTADPSGLAEPEKAARARCGTSRYACVGPGNPLIYARLDPVGSGCDWGSLGRNWGAVRGG